MGLQDTDIVPLMTIILEEIQHLEYSFPTTIANYRFMIYENCLVGTTTSINGRIKSVLTGYQIWIESQQ